MKIRVIIMMIAVALTSCGSIQMSAYYPKGVVTEVDRQGKTMARVCFPSNSIVDCEWYYLGEDVEKGDVVLMNIYRRGKE